MPTSDSSAASYSDINLHNTHTHTHKLRKHSLGDLVDTEVNEEGAL